VWQIKNYNNQKMSKTEKHRRKINPGSFNKEVVCVATNETANNATAFGMTLAIGALFSPITVPIGLLGIICIPIARGVRAVLDNQAEKNEEREREEREEREDDVMKNIMGLPTVRSVFPELDDYSSLSSSLRFLPTVPSPEDTIARFCPNLAASLLRTESGNNLLNNLANSSVATEFARQGRGTRAGVRTKKNWFTGGETTEAFIEPI
jgi:hypothetical protein